MRKDIIKTKLKEIEGSTKLVKENLPGNFEDFSKLGLVKDGIYKRIEYAIEGVLDVCAIINSDLELGVPASEEDIVDNLVNNDILSSDMGMRIKKMRGFRNFLVHRYGKIDDKVAYENIMEGFADFSEFTEKINEFLATLPNR